MGASSALAAPVDSSTATARHAAWVRVCHWVGAASFLVLAITGFLILMVHPRLYWGQVGNDLTPALIELPISANHRPEGWTEAVTFGDLAGAPISANRTYAIFNQNGWGRSLHFLAGWFLVACGLLYLLVGFLTGHLQRDVLPRLTDLTPGRLWQDFRDHLRAGAAQRAASYGLLQRCAYAAVALIAVPFMVLTGLSMSPAVTAAYPVLSAIFGGHQTARTLHFFGFAALVLFLIVHLTMVVLTGFRRQVGAMITGN